jgi:hypothetical protein
MAELCAVLAFAAIANGDRIGLLLCSDRIELLLPPRKGRRHTLRLVREVLGFEPAGRGTDLGLALDHLRHVLNRRSVVFVVSDFMTPGWEDALATAARRHDVIALCVEDPAEAELPDVGLLDVSTPKRERSARSIPAARRCGGPTRGAAPPARGRRAASSGATASTPSTSARARRMPTRLRGFSGSGRSGRGSEAGLAAGKGDRPDPGDATFPESLRDMRRSSFVAAALLVWAASRPRKLARATAGNVRTGGRARRRLRGRH